VNDQTFKAERVSKSASITLNGPIEKVFPLFGAVEEKKWADGWDPVVLYPESGHLEEGMTFITRAHGHDETTFAWIVSQYQPECRHIEYVVSTPNRIWVIAIQCDRLSVNQTIATIRYTYTGLTALGNVINKHVIEKMFKRNLADWEEEINYFLQSGKKALHPKT
jgi:hypothetical protein